MKRVPKPVFFVVALLILAFSFTAIFGISYYTGDNKTTVLKGISDIRWGIDIRGGVEATFKPAGDVDATDEQLESAKSIIELRMVSQGITDYELYADAKSDRIIVRFPWKEDSDQNAIEAIGNQPDGRIELKASCNDMEEIWIEIKNNGPEIPAEIAEHIFIPFFTTKDGGTGLGLPIVQSIITSHGGEIQLENGPEGGALVRVLLPEAHTGAQE